MAQDLTLDTASQALGVALSALLSFCGASLDLLPCATINVQRVLLIVTRVQFTVFYLKSLSLLTLPYKEKLTPLSF